MTCNDESTCIRSLLYKVYHVAFMYHVIVVFGVLYLESFKWILSVIHWFQNNNYFIISYFKEKLNFWFFFFFPLKIENLMQLTQNKIYLMYTWEMIHKKKSSYVPHHLIV